MKVGKRSPVRGRRVREGKKHTLQEHMSVSELPLLANPYRLVGLTDANRNQPFGQPVDQFRVPPVSHVRTETFSVSLSFSRSVTPAISPKDDLAACDRGLEEVNALDERDGEGGLPRCRA
jgi:hypothetical protein